METCSTLRESTYVGKNLILVQL